MLTPVLVNDCNQHRITIMNDKEVFVAYVGSPDFHDGFVRRVSVEGKTVEVVIEGYSGSEYVVLFEGVDEIEQNVPEGMELYSLSEMSATPPFRKFVFANNVEEHPGLLSIVAKDFSVRPSNQGMRLPG